MLNTFLKGDEYCEEYVIMMVTTVSSIDSDNKTVVNNKISQHQMM